MFADEIPNPTVFHIYGKKIVGMIEKGSLEIKSRSHDGSERESVRRGDTRETKSWAEQQIVVLKMWEKCKNFHFGFFYCTCKTPTHTQISARRETNLPFFCDLYSTCWTVLQARTVFVIKKEFAACVWPLFTRLSCFRSLFFKVLQLLPLDNRILFKRNCQRLLYVGWDYTDFILSECYAHDFRQWLFLKKKTEKRQTKDLREARWECE